MCASSSSVLFSPFQVLFTIFFHSFSILGLVHHLLPFFQAPKNPFHLNPFFLLHLNPFLKIPNPNHDLNRSKNPNPKITISSCVVVMRFLGFCVAHDFFLRWCFLGCVAVMRFWVSTLLWFLVLFFGGKSSLRELSSNGNWLFQTRFATVKSTLTDSSR